MSYVFVMDTDKQPPAPVCPGRARLLLKEGKAAVYRRYPFTLILNRKVEQPTPAPLRRSDGYTYHPGTRISLPLISLKSVPVSASASDAEVSTGG